MFLNSLREGDDSELLFMTALGILIAVFVFTFIFLVLFLYRYHRYEFKANWKHLAWFFVLFTLNFSIYALQKLNGGELNV